jgi:hypothetical protein
MKTIIQRLSQSGRRTRDPGTRQAIADVLFVLRKRNIRSAQYTNGKLDRIVSGGLEQAMRKESLKPGSAISVRRVWIVEDEETF